jgi:hypothetical protein
MPADMRPCVRGLLTRFGGLVHPLLATVALASAMSVAACGTERTPAAPTRPTPEPTVTLVEIEGAFQLASPGLTTQLRAFATYSDGIQYDVTREAVWTVFDQSVVRVAPGGMATATGYGETTVHASYGGVVSRFGFGFRVTPLAGPQYALTGVVRDASTGAPLPFAQAVVRFSAVLRVATSDGSGFFDLGSAAGPTEITIARIGYQDAMISPTVDAPTRLAVNLVPTPGSFIERSLEDQFTQYSGPIGFHTFRISTKPDRPFEAQVQGLDCDSSPALSINVLTDGRTNRGGPGSLPAGFTCYSRARLDTTNGDVEITVTGRNLKRFRLTYRESR